MELIAHDLVRINDMEDLVSDLPLPGWAVESLTRTPYAVVRRTCSPDGFIGVGIRGSARGQRVAAWLRLSQVEYVIKPSVLAVPENWIREYQYDMSPPVYSLKRIAPILSDRGFDWGPTGSTGYELATGAPAITENSDLDILINVSIPFNSQTAADLLQQLESVSLSRLDVQLNTPIGGVSLKDYSTAEKVLVKKNTGPVLLKPADVWFNFS